MTFDYTVTHNTTLIDSMGQYNNKEGTVQITDFLGTHGVCDAGWDRGGGMAVCRSIGYW